jgi:hypothetical protein
MNSLSLFSGAGGEIWSVDSGIAYQKHMRDIKSKSELVRMPSLSLENSVCREISRVEAKQIILEYEWLGTMGLTQTFFGAYLDGILSGVVAFGFFQAMNTSKYKKFIGEKYKDHGCQLTRGASAYWAHPHTGSMLIGFALREMGKRGYKYAVAFSDPDAGEVGILYQATNWIYIGATNDKHWDIYDKESRKCVLNDRDAFKQLGFRGRKKLSEYISDKPGLELRERKPKARYIKPIGTKRENKEMLKYLIPNSLMYPKRVMHDG